MAKIINTTEKENLDKSNQGIYYDPFMYTDSSDVGYKKKLTDKYVDNGTYDSDKNELDLKTNAGDEIKINLSGATKNDRHVTDGTSIINEEEQKLILSVGDSKGLKTKVNIDLSGLSTTYSTKSELDDKFTWKTF